MPVKEHAPTTLTPSAIRYSGTATSGRRMSSPDQIVPMAQRASRPATTRTQPPQPTTTRRRAAQPAANTSADTQIAPERLRPIQRTPHPSEEDDYEEYFDAANNPYVAQQTEQLAPSQQQRPGLLSRLGALHPLVYIGATTLALVGTLLLTTSGAAWWTTHVDDPGTYGPMHGSVITARLGGSSGTSEIVGWNDGGKVMVIVLSANNHAQIIPGSDLRQINFPGDAAGAEVLLEIGDFNHDGREDIRVDVLSTTFDQPFHRYGQSTTLYGDGKGGLKIQATGGQ